jgi:hypothetical protein
MRLTLPWHQIQTHKKTVPDEPRCKYPQQNIGKTTQHKIKGSYDKVRFRLLG